MTVGHTTPGPPVRAQEGPDLDRLRCDDDPYILWHFVGASAVRRRETSPHRSDEHLEKKAPCACSIVSKHGHGALTITLTTVVRFPSRIAS